MDDTLQRLMQLPQQQNDIGQLMQLPGAQPQQSPMGQTNPVQPQPQQNPFDLATMVSQVSSLPQYQQAVSQLSKSYGEEGDVATQQAALAANRPQERWQPKYEPVTGAGSFLRDAGKGILQALSLTGPGQQIQNAIYEPGVRDWERKREALAGQLQTIKAQQEVPQEELRGLTGLTNAGAMASWRGGELENQRRKVDAYTQNVQNRLATAMRGLDLRALMNGSQIELNKAKTVLDQVLAQTAPERIALGYYTADANNYTRQSLANVLAQLGIDKTHPVAQTLDAVFGTSLTPPAPQTPGGAQPVQGQTPPFTQYPKRPNAGPGATAPSTQGSNTRIKPKGSKPAVIKWGRDKNGNPVKLSQ